MADGVIPSPNIWNHPQVYELENRSVDPDGVIETAMAAIQPWEGATVLDVGCGAGFHLPRFAEQAARVIGVEPHLPLLALARRRTAGLPTVQVREGTAQRLPLPEASVDVAHARWAYFFGPGCEPGLRELARVVRRGGVAFVVDNDGSRSTFGRWFRTALPTVDPLTVERFWSTHGFTRLPLEIRWQMASREEFEACVRIEFDHEHAQRFLAEHPGTAVDYAVNLFWHRY